MARSGPLEANTHPRTIVSLTVYFICQAFPVFASRAEDGKECKFCHLCEPGEKKRRKKAGPESFHCQTCLAGLPVWAPSFPKQQ